MSSKITAQELFQQLSKLNISNYTGNITFNLAGISVNINTTDTVGTTLQAWLKQYLINNDYFFSEPPNTQEFPDFFLNDINPYENMLEVKSFNYYAQPAFDIANFESYCESVKINPYRLDADYLIFGYGMNNFGDISIERIWLHKIWQIAGRSERYPLKTQVKRDMIYNIRPNSNFKSNKNGVFSSKEDFLKAIYDTLILYKNKSIANDWLNTVSQNFEDYYRKPLEFLI